MERKVMIIPVLVSVILIAAGMALGDPATTGNIVIIAIIISVVPLFIYKYSKFLWLKSIEEQFPNFIRDLADSIRSGMSFEEAIKIAARNNYGKLSAEVKAMKNRLSWGTPLLRVLEIFGKKTKDSKIITESLHILRESFESGGNVASTLDSITNGIIVIKEAEAERESIVKQHVAIMYGVFFMFLFVAIIIIFVMVPMIKSQPQAAHIEGPLSITFIDPCEGMAGFPCNLFTSTCLLFDMNAGIACYYTSLFFFVVIIQGIFTGLIAGQVGENSIIAGSKHSLIMLFSALAIFLFLAKAGLFPA